jgi:hypothetical protein
MIASAGGPSLFHQDERAVGLLLERLFENLNGTPCSPDAQ